MEWNVKMDVGPAFFLLGAQWNLEQFSLCLLAQTGLVLGEQMGLMRCRI